MTKERKKRIKTMAYTVLNLLDMFENDINHRQIANLKGYF